MSRVRTLKISNRIINNADDAYLDNANTFTDNNSIEFGNNGSGACNAFVYFDSVFIPKASTIVSAYLRVMAANTYTTTNCNIRMYGGSGGYFAAPTTSATYNSTTMTTAYKDWMNIQPFTVDKTYLSPDISSIIQEIINQSTWSEGHPIAIFLKNHPSTASSSSARRSAYTVNSSSSKCARLIVNVETTSTILNDPPVAGDPISWTRLVPGVTYATPHKQNIPKKPTLSLIGNGDLSGLYSYKSTLLIGDPISGEFVETTPSSSRSIYTSSHKVYVAVDLSQESIYTGYRIYRTISNGNTYYLLNTSINPTSKVFTDNTADSDLDTYITPPTITTDRLPVVWGNPQFPFSRTMILPFTRPLAGITQTNPTNRRFWVTNLLSTAYSGSAGYVAINDGSTDFNIWTGLDTTKMVSAIPVHTSLKRSASSITAIASGVVTPTSDGITPVIKKVTNASGYTVPNNKNFYLLGVGADDHEMFSWGTAQASGSSATLAVYPALSSANNTMFVDAIAVDSTNSPSAGGSQSTMGASNSPFCWGISRKSSTSNTTMSWSNLSGAAAYAALELNPTGGNVTFDTTFGLTWSSPTSSQGSGSGTVGANANRLLIACIITRNGTGSGANVKSCVYDGQNMTRIRQDGRSDVRVELWGLVNPNSGAGKSATVTFEESVTAGVFSLNFFYNCVQTLNGNMLTAKVDGVNTHNILIINDQGGPKFKDGGLQPVPGHMVFGPGDVLSCSDSVSGNGVVIYGYEVYNGF